MNSFLTLSKSITREVAAGEITVAEAKARLVKNANTVVSNTVTARLKILSGKKVMPWDNMWEKQALKEEPEQ